MQTKIEFHKRRTDELVGLIKLSVLVKYLHRCWFWIPSVALFSYKPTHLIFTDRKKVWKMVQICLWYNSVYLSSVHVSWLWPFLSSSMILWSTQEQFSSCWTMCAISTMEVCAKLCVMCKSADDLESQVGAMATIRIFFILFSCSLSFLSSWKLLWVFCNNVFFKYQFHQESTTF